MKIWDAFYGKRNISALSSESRLFLFFGWPAPVRRVRSLLPLPPKLERDCPDAAWRQMQRAIQNEGELPSPFYIKLPDGPRVRADGSADIKWLIDPNRKPKNGAKLFRALQHMRAGREMEAQLALQDALPFFGAVAYLEELRPWLAKHKKF